MKKQAYLATTTVFLVIGSIAGGVYTWWQSTPQFALLEARKGFVEKDRKKFNKYLDVANLMTSFSEEIIFEPAETTPNLSKLQRIIGLGALHAARPRIDNSLIFQVQSLVKNKPPAADQHSEKSDSSEDDTANGVTLQAKIVESPKPFTAIVRQQWKREKERLKRASIDRMIEYARSHPNTLVNRIFAAPVGRRATAVKDILAECGFKGSNFKAYQFERKGASFIAHLTFFSPRIKDLVTVRLEMEHIRDGVFGRWRVSRLVNFKKTLIALNYDTDEQIHGLVSYGLKDLTAPALADQAKEAFSQIRDSSQENEKEALQ